MNKPARVIRPNRRSLTGQVSIQGGASAPFESSLERDFLVILDFDRAARDVLTQPLTIKFQGPNGVKRQYTPDVLVKYEAYPKTLYEVKYRKDLWNDWAYLRPRFKEAIRYCRERDWRFHILTEQEIRGSAILKNARFLRGYRDHPCDEGIEEHLVRTLAILGETTPQALLEASYWTQDWKMRAIGSLWRMVARGRIHTNMLHPLTMTSPLWVTIGEGFLWQNPLSCQLRQARS